MRWRVRRWLDCENVKSTLNRLSWLFEGQPSLYIERIVSLMKTIVFNSIQVINYWFTLHRALRPLYQQAQTSSPYIWGISDQNVTFFCSLKECVLLYKSHYWHNQIKKVLDELLIEVCKAYETLYSFYWFKSLSVHDCLHLLRIHLYVLFNFQNKL